MRDYAIDIDAIKEQDVKMYNEIESRSEALDQCHRTGGAILERESGLVDQVGRDRPVDDAKHLTHSLGVGGKQIAQGKGEADDPLAQWHIGEDLIGFLYSTPAYWPSLELFGLQDKGQQLLDMTRAGNWQDIPKVVKDEMMEKFVPRATSDEIERIYRERFHGLAPRITFPMPANPADDEMAALAIVRLKN